MLIGVDSSGTKIEVLLLDNLGDEIFRKRVPTPQGQYAAILHTIQQIAVEAEQQRGNRCTVGIGTPGAIVTRHWPDEKCQLGGIECASLPLLIWKTCCNAG